MKRREFIALLGGAAAWPLRARATAGAHAAHRRAYKPTADDPEGIARIRRSAGAAGAGWTEGRNVRIDYRWGGAIPTAIELCGGIGRARPDVILATSARRGGRATDDPHRADRVCAGLIRSVTASSQAWRVRGQRHRVHHDPIQHQREMAGAAQRNRATHHASGGHS